MRLDWVQLHIDQDGDRDYLTVRIPCTEDVFVQGYQVEMIANNPSDAVIPFEFHRKDNDYFFFYDITSRTSLKDYAGNHRFSGEEFISLLYRITVCLADSRGMLLCERNFICSEEYMFIEPGPGSVSLVYLPVSSFVFSWQEFRDLVIRLITRTSVTGSTDADSFLNSIIRYLGADDFSLAGFKRLLEEIKDGENSSQSRCDVSPDGYDTLTGRSYAEGSEPPGGTCNKHKNDASGRDQDSLRKKTSVFDAQVLVQAAISQMLVIVLALLADWALKAQGFSSFTRYAVITSAVLICDFTVLKLFIFKRNRSDSGLSEGGTRNISQETAAVRGGDPAMQSINTAVNNGDTVEQSGDNSSKKTFNMHVTRGNGKETDSSENGKERDYGNNSDIPDSELQMLDETTLLCDVRTGGAFLVSESEGITEKFSIDKDRFIIGRNPDVCDLVLSSKTVGRIHAEILLKDDIYYIYDKNSRNGTYLNEEKLDVGVEYRLSNGDTIVFANVQYRFAC